MHHVGVEEEKNFLASVRKRKRSTSVDDIAFEEVVWEAPPIPEEPLRPHIRYNYRRNATWRTPKSLIKYLGHGQPRPTSSTRQPSHVVDQRPAPLALYDAPIDTGSRGRRRTPSLKQRLRDEYVSIIQEQSIVAHSNTPTAAAMKGIKRKSPDVDDQANGAAARSRARPRSRRSSGPSTPQATDASQLKLLKKLQYLRLRRQLAIIQRTKSSPPLVPTQSGGGVSGEVIPPPEARIPSPPVFTLQS